MILTNPIYLSNTISALSRAITESVARPSHPVICKLNGLLYKLRVKGPYNFLDNRECYYNFRHDGAEAFGFYNLKSQTLAKAIKVGTGTTHVPNSHIALNGSAGYINLAIQLAQYGIWNRNSNAHHVGVKVLGANYAFGVNAVSIRYTMLTNSPGRIRLNCDSVNAVDPSVPITSGKLKVGRINATTVTLNKNGAFVENIAQAADATSQPPLNLYLGCRNHNGTADGAAGVQLSYYSHGALTTDADDLIIYNAETAYENHLLELPI